MPGHCVRLTKPNRLKNVPSNLIHLYPSTSRERYPAVQTLTYLRASACHFSPKYDVVLRKSSFGSSKNTLDVGGLVYVHIYDDNIDYRYNRSSRSSTSFGFLAFFPFALLPSFSKIHSHPRTQCFLIWFLVPMDPGNHYRKDRHLGQPQDNLKQNLAHPHLVATSSLPLDSFYSRPR